MWTFIRINIMSLKGKILAKIKYIQSQPESVKVIYIWIFTGIVFAIVVLLWAGVFRKYERKAADDGKSAELIEAGEKLINDIKSKIKVPDSELPENSPEVSPIASPLMSPEISPEASSEIIPEALQ